MRTEHPIKGRCDVADDPATAAAAEASSTRPGVDDLGWLVHGECDRVARLARLAEPVRFWFRCVQSQRLELAVVVRLGSIYETGPPANDQ